MSVATQLTFHVKQNQATKSTDPPCPMAGSGDLISLVQNRMPTSVKPMALLSWVLGCWAIPHLAAGAGGLEQFQGWARLFGRNYSAEEESLSMRLPHFLQGDSEPRSSAGQRGTHPSRMHALDSTT